MFFVFKITYFCFFFLWLFFSKSHLFSFITNHNICLPHFFLEIVYIFFNLFFFINHTFFHKSHILKLNSKILDFYTFDLIITHADFSLRQNFSQCSKAISFSKQLFSWSAWPRRSIGFFMCDVTCWCVGWHFSLFCSGFCTWKLLCCLPG